MASSISTTIKAPVGPVQMVSRIITLIDELIEVMNLEVDLIQQRKMPEHAELLKRKQRLTLDYRASLKDIALQPDLLKKVPEDLRLKASAAARRLGLTTQHNGHILRGAMQAIEQLTRSIITMVKADVLPNNSYGNPNNGRAAVGYSPTCKPVTGSRTA